MIPNVHASAPPVLRFVEGGQLGLECHHFSVGADA
jgi:hypothetical protein